MTVDANEAEVRAEVSKATVYFALGDHAAHEGWLWIVPVDGEWTYQEITAGRAAVLYEGPDAAEAQRKLAAFLACDSAERGTYCYSHNPGGRR